MLKLIWQLSMFKAKPYEMPYSWPLLVGVICINFSVVMLLTVMITGSLIIGAWKAILLLLVTALFSRTILQFRGVPARFVQTLTGLLSTQSFVLAIALFPYIMLMSILPDVSSNVDYILGLSICGLLLIIASVWLFLIYSTIVESALETSMNNSLLITMILFGLQATLFGLLYF